MTNQTAWSWAKPLLGFVDLVIPSQNLPQRWVRSDQFVLDLKNCIPNHSAILSTAISSCDLIFPAKYLLGFVDQDNSQVGLLQRWEESDSIALDLTSTDLQP